MVTAKYLRGPLEAWEWSELGLTADWEARLRIEATGVRYADLGAPRLGDCRSATRGSSRIWKRGRGGTCVRNGPDRSRRRDLLRPRRYDASYLPVTDLPPIFMSPICEGLARSAQGRKETWNKTGRLLSLPAPQEGSVGPSCAVSVLGPRMWSGLIEKPLTRLRPTAHTYAWTSHRTRASKKVFKPS